MKKPVQLQSSEIGAPEESLDTINTDVPNLKEAVVVADRDISSPLSRGQLMTDWKNDPELCKLADEAFSLEEASQVGTSYYDNDGVLMRKWQPTTAPANEEWQIVHQIVVPRVHRSEILQLAHASPMADHLGINKTYHKNLSHFYWPDVLIDCVGPLPKTKSGNQCLLTIMCQFTRLPEAIPLRNIKVCKILDSLVKFVWLPVSIQSDQGSNFMSALMQQVIHG